MQTGSVKRLVIIIFLARKTESTRCFLHEIHYNNFSSLLHYKSKQWADINYSIIHRSIIVNQATSDISNLVFDLYSIKFYLTQRQYTE